MNCWCAGVLLFCGLDALSPARADEESALDDDWNFQGVIYGYFPTFGGSTSFPSDGDAVDVSAEAILDSLVEHRALERDAVTNRLVSTARFP